MQLAQKSARAVSTPAVRIPSSIRGDMHLLLLLRRVNEGVCALADMVAAGEIPA